MWLILSAPYVLGESCAFTEAFAHAPQATQSPPSPGVLPPPARALGAAPDFSGTWALDLAASDSIEPILVAQGVSWAERQAAKSITATQHITQGPGAITIDIDSTVVERTETLPTDGSPQIGVTRDGQPRVTRTAWDGAALVTTSFVTTPKGTQQIALRRTLEEGNQTLRQRIVLTMPDGQHFEVDRIYRRKAP